ncbi:MAG: OmpA family protein, partial [Myxococcota bacterium]|nr:OmpA family protein [Myxococcota bacterium]
DHAGAHEFFTHRHWFGRLGVLGDLGFHLKWRILDRDTWPVGLAIWPEVFFPTGDETKMGGDGGFGFGFRAGIDRKLGPVLLAANLGGRFRDGTKSYLGAEVGQQLVYGAVVDWGIDAGGIFHVAAEAHGAVALDGADYASPVEILGSFASHLGPVTFVAGGGAGLDRSVGSPEWRVLVAASYTFERTRDEDDDGVEDEFDRCVDRPEDHDGYEDEDGCPDDDNDGDGIPDATDRCPNAAETHNGFQDDDGCPDQAPAYVFRRGERIVFHNILFAAGKYEILPESYPVLDEVIASLQAQPLVRVRVEGHTDDRGNDNANLTLSQQRALAIANYLAGAGVDQRRLEYAGYGETRPVAPNDSDENRAQNRRVEFLTLDQPMETVETSGTE